jgi:hypothetical protein
MASDRCPAGVVFFELSKPLNQEDALSAMGVASPSKSRDRGGLLFQLGAIGGSLGVTSPSPKKSVPEKA